MGVVIYLRRASLADMTRLKAKPAGWESFAFEEGEAGTDIVEFDKAWHALHFMLTGSVGNTGDPLAIIVEDDEVLGTDEHGSGGFSLISPERMQTFNEALKKLSDEDIAGRYDPDAMAKENVYLADVLIDEGEEALEYVMQGVPALRRFAESTAQRGDGAMRIIA